MGHAEFAEDFLGLSDIVFPCFLFAVGMSIPYAIESAFHKGWPGQRVAGHILTRTLALLVMGVFLVNLDVYLKIKGAICSAQNGGEYWA